MNTKDKAIIDILKDFEALSKIVLQQLNFLDTLLYKEHAEKNIIYESMLKNEDIIDSYEIRMNEDIIKTIVLYHPLASELRSIMACIRMVSSLERIGDLSMNIIDNIRKVDNIFIDEEISLSLHTMLTKAKEMVQKAISSFSCKDIDLASSTITDDDIVDDLYEAIRKSIIDDKIIEKYNDKDGINSLICINNISLNLERIADNATNIAEAAIYMLQGKDVRHIN
jgi:phosphate transport system protein